MHTLMPGEARGVYMHVYVLYMCCMTGIIDYILHLYYTLVVIRNSFIHYMHQGHFLASDNEMNF